MAVESSREAPDGRYVLLVGLVALVMVAAFSFGRVYQGSSTGMRLALVAAIAVLLGAAFERRNLALATLVSAAGLVLAASLLVFRSTTVYGLPTGRTLQAAMDAFASVARTSNSQVAPAQPLPPLLVAGITAVWAAAYAAHALAVRARSPLLALAPPAALMVFAGVIMGDGARPAYMFVFLIAGLAVMFGDGLRRVAAWGPVSVWHERSSIRSGGGPTARAAVRIALGCLFIALFTPWLLPGFGSKGLLSVHGSLAASVSIDPIVDIRPRLLHNPSVQVFTVNANGPAYWRFLTLSTFNGQMWTYSQSAVAGQFPVDGILPSTRPDLPCVNPATTQSTEVRLVPRTCPPGYPDAGPTVISLRQAYSFGPLTQTWLPAAADPQYVGITGTSVRFDPVSDAIQFPDGSYRGLHYVVNSLEVIPTPAELNAIPSLETPANPGWQSDLELPANLPAQIGQIARHVTADADTPYGKVMAIQDYLRDNFTYDLHVPAPRSANDLVYFLTKSHRGYCEQFAGTMAVMLRTLGIPARVALGFTPGSYDGATQSYRVGTQDSHAWVEVEFPEYGWLSFEPTPTRDNPTASAYDTPPAVGGGNRGCQTTGALRGVPCTPGGGNLGRGGSVSGRNTGPLGRLRHERNGGGFEGLPPLAPKAVPLATRVRRAGLLILLAAIVVALVLIPPAKATRRRFRVRSSDPRTRTIGAFQLLADHAADVGLGRLPYETPHEYGRRIAEACPGAAAPVTALAAATARATYSAGAVSPQQADEAVGLARTAARELSHASPWPRRIAGAYRVGWWNPGGRWVAPARPVPVRPPTLLRA